MALPKFPGSPAYGGTMGGRQLNSQEAALDAQAQALQGISDALHNIGESLANTPDAILRSRSWEYFTRGDRASRSLAAGRPLSICDIKQAGWFFSFFVRSNSNALRLRLVLAYPGGNTIDITATPRELQDDGLTRPTQTFYPYNTLFDDVATQYAMAIDVPWPGQPFEGLAVQVENRTSAAITIAYYTLRLIRFLS